MQARDDLLRKRNQQAFRHRPQTSVGRYKRDSALGLDAPDPKSYHEVFLQANRGGSQAVLNATQPVTGHPQSNK